MSIIIKVTSGGPIIYKQKRIGLAGKEFDIYKFRTMYLDSEKNGPQWAIVGDQRITKFGKFLRVTRLDEIPQLLNFLFGDMSVVGPRPERPEFCSQLNKAMPFYNHRNLTRPGLTGWAQIRYKYGSSQLDAKIKLQYDLYYVQHMSLLLDIQIIIMTIPMLMKGSR